MNHNKPLAKPSCVVMKGHRDKESVLMCPVMENQKGERVAKRTIIFVRKERGRKIRNA